MNKIDEDKHGFPVGFIKWYNTAFSERCVDRGHCADCEGAWRAAINSIPKTTVAYRVLRKNVYGDFVDCGGWKPGEPPKDLATSIENYDANDIHFTIEYAYKIGD